MTDGELVKVAWAANQAEAELIQGMLLEQGIPSMVRRTRGFDVPDFLAAGPRDIVVPLSAVERARGVLDRAEVGPPTATGDDRPVLRALIIALGVLAAAGATAAIAWLALQTGA